MPDPLAQLIASNGVAILDGGLATELEHRGADLSDALWSARLLRTDPAMITAVHAEYLAAGADCIISASYQATTAGFVARGCGTDEARALIGEATRLALSARDSHGHGLVAASVGPYGAALADGSEFTGLYDRDEEGLVDFHAGRLDLLAASGPDLLACETVPSVIEARALARLLAHASVPAWISFSCRDGAHISDGTPLAEAIRVVDDAPGVVAVGINCTAPSRIPSLLAIARTATRLPLVVYPNSGESWDAERRCWRGIADPADFAQAALRWRDAGARAIGGCCRTRPAHVRALKVALGGSGGV